MLRLYSNDEERDCVTQKNAYTTFKFKMNTIYQYIVNNFELFNLATKSKGYQGNDTQSNLALKVVGIDHVQLLYIICI